MSLLALATAYGGPEVLTVTDETVGEPGRGEARIAVRASGVNPVDYKSYSGAFGRDPSRLPLRLGSEAAGVITAVGPDAAGPAGPLAVGDEVIAYRAPGAYAAELLAPAQSLVPRPAGLDWPQAAGLMLTGVTAWHALAVTDVHEGDTMLVHGGAGGVGVMAIQLATVRGARVVATASPANHDLLRELGAVPVSYGNGLADRVRAAAPQGVSVAVDTVRRRRRHRRLPGARRRPEPDRHRRRVRPRIGTGHQGDRRRARRRPRHGDPAGRTPGPGATGPRQAAPGDRQPDVPAHRGRGGAPGHHERPHPRQDRTDPVANRRLSGLARARRVWGPRSASSCRGAGLITGSGSRR